MPPVTRDWRGPEVRALILANVKIGLQRSASTVQLKVKHLLNQGGPGPPSPPGSPPHKQTGQLGQSIQIDRTGIDDPRRPHVRVGTSLRKIPYARIQEYGGTIVPKRGKFLRFKTHDGSWHMARRVRLPPRPYLRPGLQQSKQAILKNFTARALLRGF